MANPIAIDFETYYDSECSVGKPAYMIPWEYCRDERFDAYLISAYDGDWKWVGHPSEFPWRSLEGRIVLAHNERFERDVLHFLRDAFPTLFQDLPQFTAWDSKGYWKEFHCTANLTSYLCNKRSLDDAVYELYGVRIDKSARSDMKGLYWHQISPEQQKIMRDYAIKDVEWCWKIWRDHSHKWPEMERHLANLTTRQGSRGTAINRDLLTNYRTAIDETIEATEAQIPWVAVGKAPSSSHAVAWQCRQSGIDCPPVKGEDEEGYTKWEHTYRDEHPWVELASSYRSLTKLRSTFQKVRNRLRVDDTAPFGLKYFGAHTGRWSGDAGVNMQNPRKESVFINEKGLMETREERIKHALGYHQETGKFPDWVRHEINFRYLIVPRPGKKMILSDLSQIEPRVLAWIVNDGDFLRFCAEGQSPYEAHARASMGWTGGSLKKEDPGMYALAKARVLALGYGCGWNKFIAMAYEYTGMDITVDDPEWEYIPNGIDATGRKVLLKRSGYGQRSREVVNDFRKSSPRVTGLWNQLHNDFRASVGEDYYMTLPSGRVMRYHDVRRQVRVEADDEGKPRSVNNFTALVGYKRSNHYGGKLCENLVQATARDVFGEHLVTLDKIGGIDVLFSTHDEAVTECAADINPKDIEEIMSHCPEWIKGLPLAAEAKEVPHYTK